MKIPMPNLEERRKALFFTQTELAAILGVTRYTIMRAEETGTMMRRLAEKFERLEKRERAKRVPL